MDVRIGLAYSARELEIELPDDADVAALKGRIADALGDEHGVLWLTDRKGNEFALPSEKITFVQVGSGTEKGRLGFG